MPSRNVELKARLHDPLRARETAQRLATRHLGSMHQIDTYFRCAHGSLKLRQIDGLSAELISYVRADSTAPRASDYFVVPLSNPETVKQALAAALGVSVVVDKRREVYLYHAVRIHLDNVTSLGWFLEFEAVLGPHVDDAAGHAQVEHLRKEFEIMPADVVAVSYSDLLLDAATANKMTGQTYKLDSQASAS